MLEQHAFVRDVLIDDRHTLIVDRDDERVAELAEGKHRANLRESLLACLGDGRLEHCPRDALALVGGGDSEALVPHEAGRIRTQAVQPDHDAVHLDSLECGARVGHPVVEDAGDVVVAVPDVAGHLRDAVAVRRPRRPND